MAQTDDLDPPEDDDEALRWAGDEERGRDAPNLRGSEPSAEVLVEDEPENVSGSRGRTFATAAFAVPYLAYAAAWIFALQNLSAGAVPLWSQVLWQFGEFLTILAVPLWFAATLNLTRDHRPLVRIGWLALGLGVLLPWPFLVDLLLAIQLVGGAS